MQQPPGYNPGKEGEAPPPYMPPTVPIASQQPATAPVMCQQPAMVTVVGQQPTVAIAQQPYAAPVMGQQPTVVRHDACVRSATKTKRRSFSRKPAGFNGSCAS
eukprot:810355_1